MSKSKFNQRFAFPSSLVFVMTMVETRFYDLLGVSTSSTVEEIKTAYRKKALQNHPDKGGDPKKFQDISEAYSVLSDPKKRSMYDRFGSAGLEASSSPTDMGGFPFPFQDIMSQMFGQRPSRSDQDSVFYRQPKMPDKEMTWSLPLAEFFTGGKRPLVLERNVYSGSSSSSCRECRGTGRHTEILQQGPFVMKRDMGMCERCTGTGTDLSQLQKTVKKETIPITISPGTLPGTVFRIKGKTDELPSLPAGNLLLHVQVRPPCLEDGFATLVRRDLQVRLVLTLPEAIFGFRKKVYHPLYSIVLQSHRFSVPSLSRRDHSPSDRFPIWFQEEGMWKVIPGLGLSTDKHSGNLLVSFQIERPPDLQWKDLDPSEWHRSLPRSHEDDHSAAKTRIFFWNQLAPYSGDKK